MTAAGARTRPGTASAPPGATSATGSSRRRPGPRPGRTAAARRRMTAAGARTRPGTASAPGPAPRWRHMPTPDGPEGQIHVGEAVTGADAAQVAALVEAAAREDGVMPLSEHVLLHLRYGGDPGARDLLLSYDGALAGFAHLDPAGPEGPAGELVIHPGARHRGLGLRLARALQAESDRLAD